MYIVQLILIFPYEVPLHLILPLEVALTHQSSHEVLLITRDNVDTLYIVGIVAKTRLLFVTYQYEVERRAQMC